MSDGRAYRFEFASQLNKCLRVPLPAKLWLTAAAGESGNFPNFRYNRGSDFFSDTGN